MKSTIKAAAKVAVELNQSTENNEKRKASDRNRQN